MNKTLSILTINTTTTTSNNTLQLIPTRIHSTTNLLKNKEVTDKNSRTSRSRDVLCNITNNNNNNNTTHNNKENKEDKRKLSQGSKATKREKSKSSKISKRSAAVLADTESNVVVGGDAKKRKSDPMLIDVESDALVVSPVVPPAVIPPVPQVPEWEDIDVNDNDDPQAVSEYVNEIYENLKEKEQRDRINHNYISVIQHDINEKMRSILVDWLIEVHRMFKLLPETLFLAVNIIDRYLQSREVAREKLQLVGITSMLIASKYEEIFAPECNDFVYISDGAYTKEQILSMEQTILNVLSFNLTHPSPLHFLRRYSKAAGSDYTIHTLCKYLIEVMLIDVKLLKFTSSQVAAGSVFIARAMTGKVPLWTPTLEHYSGYSDTAVRVVALEMNEALKKSRSSSLKALKKKYSTPKYGQVADIPVVDL